MAKCHKHPENEAIYKDSKHTRDSCFECVWSYFEEKRGMARREEDGRLTCRCDKEKIYVGNFNSSRDCRGPMEVIFNVSDTFTEYADHWFPINEIGPWSYSPFFWFKRLADIHRDDMKLVHCHAGVHRSQQMAYCWLLSLGYDLDEARTMLGSTWAKDDFIRDSAKGTIPPKLLQFYTVMNAHPEWSLAGCLRDVGVDELLKNT